MGSVDDNAKNALLAQRYGTQPVGDYPWNQTISLLLNHIPVRHFLEKELPENTLETLMAAAQSASTGSLLHSWSAVAVADPERKSHIALLYGDQQFIREAPWFLLFCADLGRIADASAAQNPFGSGQGFYLIDLFVMTNFDAGQPKLLLSLLNSWCLVCATLGQRENNAQDFTESA